MSDAPKFEVIDRRKLKAQEELETAPAPAPEREVEREKAAPPSDPSAGPRLVKNEVREAVALEEPESAQNLELPPAPTAEESSNQKAAYDASAQRLEELVRAQNPATGAQPPVTFDQLVQQLYVSGLIQMGAGTPEGQQPRVDIMGARNTIDLIAVLAEKTRGNLSPTEDRMLQAALYELRMAFLELSGMISLPGVPPPPVKR